MSDPAADVVVYIRPAHVDSVLAGSVVRGPETRRAVELALRMHVARGIGAVRPDLRVAFADGRDLASDRVDDRTDDAAVALLVRHVMDDALVALREYFRPERPPTPPHGLDVYRR